MPNKVFNLESTFDVSVKALESEDDILEIHGYANAVTKDRGGDIVLESAWSKKALRNFLKNPIVLAFHKHDSPVGLVTSHSVDSKGLHITATISKTSGRVYDLIKEGILRTFSIGFLLNDGSYDIDTDTFTIKQLELLEVSVVSVPSNQDSIFSIKKAFDSDEDYNKFKLGFIEEDEPIISKGEIDMPLSKEEMDTIKAEAKAAARAEVEAEAVAKAAEDARIKEIAITVGKSSEDKLMEAVEAKIAEKDASIENALTAVTEMKNELKEKSDELLAMKKNKMTFDDKGGRGKLDTKAQDEAVLLAKILGKSVGDTVFGKDIITKSDGAHQDMTEDWEQEFSLRMLTDIELRLVVENLFTNIPMNTITMHMPTNPAAGYAQWIPNTAFGTGAASTGVVKEHQINDLSISAYKLASKDRVTYEEEEDLIVPFLGIIRDAAIERMAKASDNALLVGVTGAASPSNADDANVYPFDGLVTYADTATAEYIGPAPTVAVTALDLQKTRRLMGKYGLNPSDCVYVVSQDVYFDLLEDDEFRTVDLVGGVATALRGQVGSVNGIPIVISTEFATAATTVAGAICVNMRNYLKGTLRGLMVERDRNIENQTNLIVATRRMGMIEMFPGTGIESSVAAMVYT